MSTRDIVDCDVCRDALTELVCDELATDARQAVVAHTRSCPSCAAALVSLREVMQVTATLPLEVPSPRIHAAVMLAARAANEQRAAMAHVARSPKEGALTTLSTWLGRIGTWAMSPQVAMASVLLLMLGVGFVALPLGREHEQTALRAAETTEEMTPAAAAATAVPATSPPEAPVDRTTPAAEGRGEARAAEESRSALNDTRPHTLQNDRPRSSSGPGSPALFVTDTRHRLRKPRGSANPNPSRSSTILKRARSVVDIREHGGAARSALSQRVASGGAASKSANRATGALPVASERRGAGEKTAIASAEFAAPPPSVPSTAEPNPVLAASSARPAAARADPQSVDRAPETLRLAQGIRATRSGDHASAIAVLKPLADGGAPSVRREAALFLARSYRASDQCRAALRYYEPLVASNDASRALMAEAVDCYERIGATERAAALRGRMQPTTSGRAEPATER